MSANMGMIGLAMASGASQQAEEFRKYAESLEKDLDKMALSRHVYKCAYEGLLAVLRDVLAVEPSSAPPPHLKQIYRDEFIKTAQELRLSNPETYIPDAWK